MSLHDACVQRNSKGIGDNEGQSNISYQRETLLDNQASAAISPPFDHHTLFSESDRAWVECKRGGRAGGLCRVKGRFLEPSTGKKVPRRSGTTLRRPRRPPARPCRRSAALSRRPSSAPPIPLPRRRPRRTRPPFPPEPPTDSSSARARSGSFLPGQRSTRWLQSRISTERLTLRLLRRTFDTANQQWKLKTSNRFP